LTLLLHGHEAISKRAAARDPAELAITIVTVEEVLTGWYSQIRRAKKDEPLIRAYAALQEAVEFFARVQILPLDLDALNRFRALRASKPRTGTNDLRIAAIALGRAAVLVSRNLRDYKGIPGLSLEDWS
jgi:tRNA(fMet)-specific endonuclease VapC